MHPNWLLLAVLQEHSNRQHNSFSSLALSVGKGLVKHYVMEQYVAGTCLANQVGV